MDLVEELKILELIDPIFKDVKYMVSGKVDDKVSQFVLSNVIISTLIKLLIRH